jgi:hypothetical protein
MRNPQRTFAAERVACGLYLLAGFVGAALAAAGALQVFMSSPPGLGLVVSGVTIAAVAWHRGRTLLTRVDRAATAADASPAKASPRIRDAIGIAAHVQGHPIRRTG